jgi:RecB family exonuclease
VQPNVLGETLSPSQANTYLACSARWAFKYFYDLPDPASGKMVRGTAVHALVAHAARAKMAGYELEMDGLADTWDAVWEESAEAGAFQQDEDVDELKASGAVLARKYLDEALPALDPVAVEVPVSGTIAGVAVRGIADLVDRSGCVIDIKTSSRRPSGLSGDHALQLATYSALIPETTSTRIDTLVSTKSPQLVTIDHAPGLAGRKLVEKIYPLVAEGIAGGLYLPNRASTLCSKRNCAYWKECQIEFGGEVQ